MTQATEPSLPVRKAEAHTSVHVPIEPASACAALRTVLLFSISAPFDLRVEEALWTRYHLERIVQPLMHVAPAVVPLAVRQELLDGAYSRALERLEEREGAPTRSDPDVLQASLEDWAATLMAMITQCYSLRPMVESALHGQIVGLLRELGIGDPVAPRAARFLPADVRHRLSARQTGS